jgi:hypothetical protein
MMTPDQLKRYYDVLVSRHDGWMLVVAIITIIGSALVSLVATYARERAKNFATMKDIAKITSEVEAAKLGFAQKLERDKAELVTRGHFSRVRYEREMQVYERVWPTISGLRDAVLALRPPGFVMVNSGEPEEDRNNRLIRNYFDAKRAFAEATEHNRPFYPPEIWGEIVPLSRLCQAEGGQYMLMNPRDDPGYWQRAIDNAEQINLKVENICEAIRKRLSKFDEA